MRFRKYVKHLGITAAVFTGLLIPTAVYAEPGAEIEYETKVVDTYLFDKDHKTSTELVFKNDLPTVPYIDVTEFLNHFYKEPLTEQLQEDGTVLVSDGKSSMTVDTDNDVVYFTDFADLLWDGIDQGDTMSVTYYRPVKNEEEEKPNELTFDFGSYNIDLLKIGGKAYFPVPTLSDMLASAYNGAEYQNDTLYYVHTSDIFGRGLYYDNNAVFDQLERNQAEADFSYDELCFLMDHFYGLPGKAAISATIGEQGFDATLEQDKTLKHAKQYLKSTDNAEFMIGLMYLQVVLYDGGHTDFSGSFLSYAMENKEEPLPAKFWQLLEKPEYEEASIMQGLLMRLLSSRESEKEALSMERMGRFDVELETVKTWYKEESEELSEEDNNIVATLYEAGDTVIFTFDDFESPVVYAFKEACDYAKENGKRNFIVDISTNGGGLTSVYGYMVTLMKNKNRDSNVLTEYSYNRIADDSGEVTVEFDLNLDGVFDENDPAFGYDLNFAILESNVAFSSGNMLPLIAKENGILLLGETSGGGECNVAPFIWTNGYVSLFSGPSKSILESGESVDLGAAPDYELVKTDPETGEKDFSRMYNAKLLDALIHEYYGDFTNEWADGVWYDKDHKASYDGFGEWVKKEDGCWTYRDSLGWYPKNRWQKIDGKWYFFDGDGCMEKDAYCHGYYVTKNGAWDGKAAVAGWTKDSKGWKYVVKGSTFLKSGWKRIDCRWYYFKADGYAAQNEFVKGYWIGNNCIADESVLYSWHKSGKGWWYGVAGGWYAKGKSYTIDGKVYTFDQKGYCVNP